MKFAQLDDSRKTELWACLALRHTAGLGAVGRKKLCDFFGSPYRAVQAAGQWRASGLGVREKAAGDFQAGRWRERARQAWDKLRDGTAGVLLYTDPLYPPRLRELNDAPLLLYYLGDLSLLSNTSLAVVGARNCTDEGMAVAANIVGGLTKAGITCVSGLARGIDRVVHIAGLAGIGSSIAVMGSGVDVPYPSDNIDLYHTMAEKGLLLSEFDPGAAPLPEHFPVRNRLISGLARGVLVVEAALRSGTLITVRHALEQNRDVFAVPGGTLAATSEGCRELIRRGARPVFSAEDVLIDLAPVLSREIGEKERKHDVEILKGKVDTNVILPWTNDKKNSKLKKGGKNVAARLAAPERPPSAAGLSGDESLVFSALTRDEARLIDDLAARTGLPVSRVSGALLMLELKGLVRHLPGMLYVPA